jgi:hypothetical protein
MLSNEKGSGLVLAILIVVALFVLATSLAFLTRIDMNISGHQTRYVEAVYVAEAGVQEAIHRLSLPDPTNMTVNGTSINAAIHDGTIPPNPNWKARIFLCRPGAAPAPGANQYHTVTVQNAANWLNYSTASELTKALTIEHKWKDLDNDGVRENGEVVLYDPSKVPPENFTTGTVVEVVTVTGKEATAERQIKAEATKFPLNVNVKAALLCNKGVNIGGNVTVCGHNHSINTPTDTKYPACQAYHLDSGGTACAAGGCLTGVMTTGFPDSASSIATHGAAADLVGNPPTNSSPSNPFYTLAQTMGLSQAEVDAILANADYTTPNAANPQKGITYINNVGGEVSWNNAVGEGLLYVSGSLRIAGHLSWKGLIYVEGDFTCHGTVDVLGAIVVNGISTYSVTSGTPSILYSSDALDYYLREPLGFVQIGWKETGGL